MNKPNRLSQEDMLKALELFIEIQQRLLAELSVGDKQLVNQWISKVVLCNPATLLRPDSLNQLNEEIFGSSEISNFVMDLVFRFYALGGSGEYFTESLAVNLADAIQVEGGNVSYSLIPEEILQSMPSVLYPNKKSFGIVDRIMIGLGFKQHVNVYELLLNNKYLVVYLLIHITNTNAIDLETNTPS